jgi:hypothetical protein
MFYSRRQIFRSVAVSKSVKIKIHKTMVQPSVVCESGTLTVAEMVMKTLSAWERKIL